VPVLGFTGEVRGYSVVAAGDEVLIQSDDRDDYRSRVDGLGRYTSGRLESLRLGWARTADFEIVYIYDRQDGFGYALNLDAPELSEWGYVPFHT